MHPAELPIRGLSVVLLLMCLAFSCGKSDPVVVPVKESQVEPDLPEKVESDFLEIAGRGWDSLNYDLRVYYGYIFRDGNIHGYGPDGRYYDMDVVLSEADSSLTLSFRLDGTLRASAAGRVRPLSLTVDACGTKMAVMLAVRDSVDISMDNMGIRVPVDFLSDSLATAPFLYDGVRVGYLARDVFEDANYQTRTCLVLHYYGDDRTFAFNAEDIL